MYCVRFTLIEFLGKVLEKERAYNNNGHQSWIWMFTKLSQLEPGADQTVRAESSHPHIRRRSAPDPNWIEGDSFVDFHLMTWLPNQSFPVISLTKHNLTLISRPNIEPLFSELTISKYKPIHSLLCGFNQNWPCPSYCSDSPPMLNGCIQGLS